MDAAVTAPGDRLPHLRGSPQPDPPGEGQAGDTKYGGGEGPHKHFPGRPARHRDDKHTTKAQRRGPCLLAEETKDTATRPNPRPPCPASYARPSGPGTLIPQATKHGFRAGGSHEAPCTVHVDHHRLRPRQRAAGLPQHPCNHTSLGGCHEVPRPSSTPPLSCMRGRLLLRCPPSMTSRSLAPGEVTPVATPVARWCGRWRLDLQGSLRLQEDMISGPGGATRPPARRLQAITNSDPGNKLQDLLDTHEVMLRRGGTARYRARRVHRWPVCGDFSYCAVLL